eukprot:1853881-Prymnesium_polylepis.1
MLNRPIRQELKKRETHRSSDARRLTGSPERTADALRVAGRRRRIRQKSRSLARNKRGASATWGEHVFSVVLGLVYTNDKVFAAPSKLCNLDVTWRSACHVRKAVGGSHPRS